MDFFSMYLQFMHYYLRVLRGTKNMFHIKKIFLCKIGHNCNCISLDNLDYLPFFYFIIKAK